jgi:hypothetical protein
MTSWKQKIIKHVEWNYKQILKPFKIICLINWFKIRHNHTTWVEGLKSGGENPCESWKVLEVQAKVGGNICALSIPYHKQYPFDNLN